MRAGVGVNLPVGRQVCGLHVSAIALGFELGRSKSPNSEAIRHKGRVEAYFLLDFLFLF